ncbi:hypothetical protein BGW41_001367 [Actinomortierella wolfii]|nr:hypothetical protein BGW41_001367 [Actinomortierella wolfii]
MAHPSMPSPAMSHPGRSMPGMTPTTPSSMSMSSPHSASSNRLHATGLGFVPPNENSIRSRYSISEGIQPLPPPPTHSTLNDLSSKGGVPYQSHPPPYNQQSQQVAIDANATHRPPHPFYIQHTPQGHPGEQPQQPQHIALPQQQQHPQQTYPPHHAPPPQRHHPYHTQDVSSNSPFQSTLLPHSSGNKRRSVADLLFVPVKSKERRSGSVSGAIGLESTSSPWTPTTVAGTPNASTLRQPSNFSRSSLSISSPTRGGPAPAPSGCNMVFTRSEHLARHERKHTGEKPFKCIVANCTRTFSRYDNMIQHTQTHSDRSKREVDVHRTGAAHSAHGIGNAGRGGSYGRGSSILHKSYVPSSVPSGNLSTPSVLATEHPSNVPNQWSNYGSPAIHGNHSPGPPPPGPRTSHSRSLSSVRSAADPNNEAFGIDPRLQEEHLRMGEATAPVQPGPGVSHLSSRSTQQSPHTPRHGSQSSSGFSTFEIQRPDTMGNRSPEGLMSGAAVMAHRCVSGSSSGSSGAIGLGVVPLTPSSVHTQPLPYVERLTPYEHEMLMEHRRSLANTPDLASSGSPSPWAPAHRGSIGSGKGGSHGNSSHEQIHHPTDEEKRRLTDHRWSTPDIASLPSPKPSTVDSTERIATQPPPARDAKPGTQWYTSGSTLQMNQASTPRMVEEVRPVSQESLGHPPFPPQPQPQPQTQQRAHSIPLPHPLAVSRLSGSPIVGQGSGSVRPVSIPSISSSSASQSASEARTSISLGSVLPPILSPHTSDPRAFSMHPPSPGVHHQHSPHLSSGRLPPTQPKSGIHPLSRSNSFSQPSPHAPSGRTSGEADESSLPSTSSMELDNLQGHASPDKHMWKRTKKSEVSEHDRLRQSLSRPSNAGISSNSAGRQYKEEYLSSAVAEMLTQDFAPVTLKSVESRLRRMDEKQYQQLRTVVSEKYAHHLKVHPLFLNNLTALLCVVEDENLVAQGKDVDNQDSAMEIDSATTLSSGASLAFERIDPDSYGHQQSTNTHTKGLQGLTITPHEEIPDFVAIVTDNMNQSPSGDTRFVLSRLHLPPHAYCLREHLNKNFTLSRNPTEWGLYRFQEYPSLRFLILKSVMLEYSKTKESLKTGKNPIEDETHGSGKDGSMAVDDPTPRSTKPKWRMALTLVESVEDNEQVPREMLDTIMQFDWTLSGHVRRAPFSEQPLMGVSRSTKVWTHLDRLALHPTELEVLGRDYEMLPPPSSMRNDESNIKEEEVEIVAARFVHTDSLAPVLMAFLWADMYREYEENGCLYDQEGDLTEDMGGHAYEERKDNEASVGNDEAGLGVQDYQGEEQRYPDVDDGSDQASMPDSFKRWRTSRRSTADSSSPSASRRGSVIPSLLTMSTITSTATQVEGTAAGSTTTTTEEQRLREKEPLVATATSTGDNNSQTSAARHANLMSTASTSVGRRISIAELCSPMQTLGNTTSYTSSNNSNAEYRK